MANFEVKGIVKHVGPIIIVSETFKKRDLILTIDYEGDYAQPLKFEAHQDKVNDANLKEILPGDIITISGNFQGREWLNPKNNITEVFNTLKIWKIAINKTTRAAAAGAPPVYSAPPLEYAPPVDLNGAPGDEDDLPF